MTEIDRQRVAAVLLKCLIPALLMIMVMLLAGLIDVETH
jgi:hypothetical protein